ncbi:host specificity protein J [Wohlfahrtiimonas populi]|uniref:host specificity protein J n=1 Tax=Wohlfahrtiimonas populi TaxID=1940240 RepID=UPI00098D60FA|nr:phage tail protein [Wohlfahrtiimonas populi]
MGGKSGGGARSPQIAPNTLNSAQKLKVLDLISSGEISGFIHGNDYPLKSVYLNDTPVQNDDGSMNHAGVQFEFNRGTLEQDYLPSSTSVDNSISVGVEVKKNTPITRTVTNQQVTSVRVTVGVDALMFTTQTGDQWPAAVGMHVQIIKDGKEFASQPMGMFEKGNKPFYMDLVFQNVPQAPFDIRCVRVTEDSMDDMLKNKTYFFSYVESVDAKFRMPGSAVAMLQIDSQQFGSNNPTRNYGVKGCVVQVPSNYDPINRTYTGLWDRLFKPAYTNNPAWVLYDVLTADECLGEKFSDYRIDIDRLYELSKYCDGLVDDGAGGKEPRFVCNMVLFGGDASTVLDNICSIFFGTYSDANNQFTVQYDQKSDPVAVYNNSSVENGEFNYSYVPATELYNHVKYEYIDENDGYRTKIDEVSDEANIAMYGLRSISITAFGCTTSSQARRCALRFLITSLTENETSTFVLGAAGIRHEQHDIVKLADNNYAGAQIGGRIDSVDGNTITVDRELKNVKEFMINIDGSVKTFQVIKTIDAKTYQLDSIVNAVDYVQFVATLNNLEPRLFRCIHIEEDSEINKYTVTAIKHNPQKEAIVDKGAEYIEGNHSILNSLPHLSNGLVTTEGKFIILRWDSLETAGSKNKYIVNLYKGSDFYQKFETEETFVKLENLPQGNYTAKIRAVNEAGQYSAELVIAFSTTYEISGMRFTPIVFGIRLNWEVPEILTADAHTEIWYAKEDNREIAIQLAKMPYPQNTYTLNGLSIGEAYYFWFRLVDINGNQGEFTRAIKAQSSQDSDDILGYLKGKITETELGDDVVNGIIKDVLNDQEFKDKVDSIIKESDVVLAINKRIADSESELQVLALTQVSANHAQTAQTTLVNAKTDDNTAQIQIINLAETSSNHANASMISTISVEAGDNKASIAEIAKVAADVDGKVEATYSLTANANGKITGFKFGTNGEQSIFNIMADSFVLSNEVNGEVVTPFIWSQNKLALDGDLIATGTIKGEALIAGSTINAPNIFGGQLNIGNGSFKVASNGALSIGDGNFTVSPQGNLHANNGYFGGVIEASEIKGDVVRVIPVSINAQGQGRVVIQPENFDRVLIINNLSIMTGFYTAPVGSPRIESYRSLMRHNGNESSIVSSSYAFYRDATSIHYMIPPKVVAYERNILKGETVVFEIQGGTSIGEIVPGSYRNSNIFQGNCQLLLFKGKI